MTPEEYSRSVLSKEHSSIVAAQAASLSAEYSNFSVVDQNPELALGVGNSVLVGNVLGVKNSDPFSSRRMSIAHRESRQQGGWIYPEWQITRPGGNGQLPRVTPFSELPSQFKPRVEILVEWVAPHVKREIRALAESNGVANTYGDGTSEALSFLELLHSHMDNITKTSTSAMAAQMNLPETVSLLIIVIFSF